jgi:ribosomal protein S18 acetylase RimI-like enzyme
LTRVPDLEVLSRAHDRGGFDCGSPPLNAFLRETARQHFKRGLSRTFVLVDGTGAENKKILGYLSLTMCRVHGHELPIGISKDYPREICGVKLARLAVAKEQHGRGLGTRLLMAAMQKSLEVFELAGGIGLFVDAKDDRAKAFYEKFGLVALSGNELKLFMPVGTIRTLIVSQAES